MGAPWLTLDPDIQCPPDSKLGLIVLNFTIGMLLSG